MSVIMRKTKASDFDRQPPYAGPRHSFAADPLREVTEAVVDKKEKWEESVAALMLIDTSPSPLSLHGPIEFKESEKLGEGSFGVVSTGKDAKTGRTVARKTMNFDNSKKESIWRELSIVNSFHHENVISLLGVEFEDKPKPRVSFYMEAMKRDLYERIYEGKNLTLEEIQLISYQILRALHYLHSAGIMHCDLKPANIFINEDLFLKIGDFGASSCWIDEEMYVKGTLIYRAPELLLHNFRYTEAIDVWAVGCIVGEMFKRRFLFDVDYSEDGNYDARRMEHLEMIIRLVGFTTDEDMDKDMDEIIEHKYEMWDFLKSSGLVDERPDTMELLKGLNRRKMTDDAAYFLMELLAFNPAKRITIDEALTRPFVSPGKERFHWFHCNCCRVTKKKERTRPAVHEASHPRPFDQQWENVALYSSFRRLGCDIMKIVLRSAHTANSQ